jgi:3-oxoacyl-[acyl-carrier protein] reductase
MDLNLNGRNAIVCGSTQGIGRACAEELALLGATVILLARDETRLKVVVDELPVVSGQRHSYIACDFEQIDDLRNKVSDFARKTIVHILVNNTGGPPPGQAIDARPEEFMRAFSNHLICNQILTQAVSEGMITAKYGRIINIVSTSVKIPIRGLGVSNAIRGAVANWSKTLSVELGKHGITVNNVLPGATMTARLESIIKRNAEKAGHTIQESTEEVIRDIPAGRIADPKEVGAAVAFLASPAASYVNGINFPVDGGRTGTL